jgi:hypothetical protein
LLGEASQYLNSLGRDGSELAGLIIDLEQAMAIVSRVENEVSDLLTRNREDWPSAKSGPLTPDDVIDEFIAGVGADRVLGALDRLTSPTKANNATA